MRECDFELDDQYIPPVEASSPAPPARFKLARFRQITMETTALYTIKDLLPRAGLVVVWGPPKCGKSFWAFDALMHVALGLEYRGHRVRTGTVVYCALEGALGFRKRVEAFRLRFLANKPAADPPFHLMDQPLALVADHAAFVASIKAQLGAEHPAVVCIDTLNRSLAGSESSDEDMSAYIKAADALRDAFGCLVVIVHHCGHDGARPRGHSSLIGALDVQIAVKRDTAGQIVAELELSKDGPVGLTLTSRLDPVEVGIDEDGDPVTSCVVTAIDAEPLVDVTKKPKKSRSLTKAGKTALRALTKALAEVGETAPASNHIPPSARVVTVDQWRTYAYKMGISDSPESRARQQAFKRAYDALTADEHVTTWGDHCWPTRPAAG